MIRAIASDLDGTLLDSDGKVSIRTARALARARAAGIQVVAATGRPPRWVHHLAPGLSGVIEGSANDGVDGSDTSEELELPSEAGQPLLEETELTHDASAQMAICSNGALVIDLSTKAIVAEHTLTAAEAAEVVRRLQLALPGASYAVEWGHGFGCDEAWMERLRRDHPSRGADWRVVVAPAETLVADPLVKVLAWHPDWEGDDLVDRATETVAHLATVTSSGIDHLVEVSARGIDKGSSLAEWCATRGIDRDDVVAFGDARNDITMLRWAGTGVAMANAHPDAIAAADEVTGTNAEDGVAAWLETHLLHPPLPKVLGNRAGEDRRPNSPEVLGVASGAMSYPGTFAAETPDKVAVRLTGSGASQTYAELDANANRLSQLFRSLGLQVGDHVAICAENHIRYLELCWGATYAGLVYTAASSRLTAGELAYILNDCAAQAFITTSHLSDLASQVAADIPAVRTRLMLDGTVEGYQSYEEAVAAQPAEPLPDRVEGVDMLYSSGTTGRPKGVEGPAPKAPLPTKPVLSLLCEGVLGYAQDMVYLSPAPMYHAAPLRFSLCVHRVGGTVVAMERFDPEDALRAIEQHHVTHSQWVPTMFIRMLKLPDEVRNGFDVSSMKVMVHAAAPCPVAIKLAIIEWFGPVVHEYYAGTEGNGFVYCDSARWLEHPGTVGQALTGVLHILDDDGHECPTGTPGTIWFEGATNFEYHNDPEKTAASRNEHGWSTLSDVGYLDDEGYLYLTDRKAYMIITGGVNVYPQEAESVLAVHPKVADVAVLGVPDDDFGEQVKAVVELVDPADATPEVEAELIAYCRDQLADVKCPRSVDFRAELPRHPTGKLYKRLLKDEYWAGHGARRI